MNKFNFKIASFLFVALVCFPFTARAASFELGGASAPAVVGETVRVPVYLNFSQEKVSIAKVDVQFPRDLLWAKSFTLADGWLPVPGEEFNLINNGRGIVLGTAGLRKDIIPPVGPSAEEQRPKLFGTIEFIAVGEGLAEIKIGNDSLALNDKNENTLGKSGGVKLAILASVAQQSLPARLFDMRLELAGNSLRPGDPLVSRVIFQSFGRVPTPVDMFFSITDESGKILAGSEGNIVVEIDAVFSKKFENLNLPAGNYVLHLTTRYDTKVEDNFSAPFSVRTTVGPPLIVGGATIFLLCFSIFLFFLRRGKKHPLVIAL